MKYFYVVIFICFSFSVGYVLHNNSPSIYIQNIEPSKEIIFKGNEYSEIISNMTLPEKVGQLFIIGHWDATSPLQTASIISTYHIGGVILMSTPTEKISDIPEWINLWQGSSTLPLIVAIDQEGGAVTRLKGSKYTQISQPNISSAEEAYSIGKKRGEELHALGITTNFAPVLETSVNSDAFLYNRVFRTPQDIVSFGSAMIKGMRDSGVVAVPKHFPGHEDTPTDSHTELPILKVTKDEFETFIQNFTDTIQQIAPSAIMTAHVQVPNLDSLYPATLSQTILTDILRTSIGFNGVVITDDMSMKAITNTWPSSEASLLSLQAGSDLVLFAAKPEDVTFAIERVMTAVENGEISEERINESLQKIFKMKEL